MRNPEKFPAPLDAQLRALQEAIRKRLAGGSLPSPSTLEATSEAVEVEGYTPDRKEGKYSVTLWNVGTYLNQTIVAQQADLWVSLVIAKEGPRQVLRCIILNRKRTRALEGMPVNLWRLRGEELALEEQYTNSRGQVEFPVDAQELPWLTLGVGTVDGKVSVLGKRVTVRMKRILGGIDIRYAHEGARVRPGDILGGAEPVTAPHLHIAAPRARKLPSLLDKLLPKSTPYVTPLSTFARRPANAGGVSSRAASSLLHIPSSSVWERYLPELDITVSVICRGREGTAVELVRGSAERLRGPAGGYTVLISIGDQILEGQVVETGVVGFPGLTELDPESVSIILKRGKAR